MTKRIPHIVEEGVEKKRCCKCKSYKPLDCYNKGKDQWDGLRGTCKDCLHAHRMKASTKERMTAYNKQYWHDTKEEQSVRSKAWRENNVEHRKAYNKKYRQEHGKEVDQRRWQKMKNDPKHKEYMAEYRPKYEKERRANDPAWKLKQNLSRRIREEMQSAGGKGKTTIAYVGCSVEHVKAHLEQQFTDGMSWENYGDWHIDHRRPCASFDFNKDEDAHMCWHYTNLQPMWGAENIKKSDSFDPETFPYEWSGSSWNLL